MSGTPSANDRDDGKRSGSANEDFTSRPTPAWFDDAKLGIMVSWGLYSVPGWAPLDPRLIEDLGGGVTSSGGPFDHMSPVVTTPYAEWYLNSMSSIGSPTWFYHQARFGGAPYDAFREAFEAAVEAWDPDGWVDVVATSGAKYIIPLTKHHDGYLLYPSVVPSPWKPGYHSGRDVIGEVAKAARARDIRFGVYYSGGLDWTAYGLPIGGFAGRTLHQAVDLSIPRSEEYGQYADAHWREIIDRYEPSILWNDIGYPEHGDPMQLFTDYYAAVPDGVVNDRFEAKHADFLTPEYHAFDEIQPNKWEMCRGVGLSFGYNMQEDQSQTLSGLELVRLLVQVVARNGNLLLGVGPDSEGLISIHQQSSLTRLGDWLSGNGEAIFGTRPWSRPVDDLGHGTVHWTSKPGVLYAIVDGAHGEVTLPLNADEFDLAAVRTTEAGPTVAAGRVDGGLSVTVPSGRPMPVAIRLPRR